jgi:hypothetical protein
MTIVIVISLGPWRLRVIFILNVLFSCRGLISFLINILVHLYIIERNIFSYCESNPLLILLASSGYANGFFFTRKQHVQMANKPSVPKVAMLPY